MGYGYQPNTKCKQLSIKENSNNQVFLGDGLVSGRDYSDETARVIDEEVERILRTQEARARHALVEHRGALDRVAAALLEREPISGDDVAKLVPEPTGAGKDQSSVNTPPNSPSLDQSGSD